MKNGGPLQLHKDTVRSEWIDYNGHMNLAYYVLVFDHATDAFLDHIGLTEQFRLDQNASTFAAELHVTYHKEVGVGDNLNVTTQLLGFDTKRIHYFHTMYDATDGKLVATNELMSLYMDMAVRRVGVIPAIIQESLSNIQTEQSKLPVPEQVGRVIGFNK